jgi:hypothetical protein
MRLLHFFLALLLLAALDARCDDGDGDSPAA